MSLPGSEERRRGGGERQWRVGGRLFVWERPLREKERAVLGERAPDGPILGARVESLVAKEAMIADEPGVFFTTSHFDGYPAVLVRLERIDEAELEEVVTEAWLARAPAKLAEAEALRIAREHPDGRRAG